MRFFNNNLFLTNVLEGLQGLLPESQKCTSIPDWFYCSFGLTEYCEVFEPTEPTIEELAEKATGEFCQFFTDNPAAAEQQQGMALMGQSGLAGRYISYFYEHVFSDIVLTALLNECAATPNWFFCAFGMTSFCQATELTEAEQLIAIEAAGEVCQFFTDTPEAADRDTGATMITEGLYTKYASYFSNPSFIRAFLNELMPNCETVPGWFTHFFVAPPE
jgi:hypothetical protein